MDEYKKDLLKYFEENTKLENEIIEQLNKVKYE